jgi:hypothetical protein
MQPCAGLLQESPVLHEMQADPSDPHSDGLLVVTHVPSDRQHPLQVAAQEVSASTPASATVPSTEPSTPGSGEVDPSALWRTMD